MEMIKENNAHGVLLVNMGGPGSTGEIFGYLYRLFSDPRIMGLPGYLRKVAAWLVARLRREKAAAKYALIGGKSPLAMETARQTDALAQVLQLPVAYAMRYSDPAIKTACRQLADRGVTRLVILPLYPQYSLATTCSVQDYLGHKENCPLPSRFIDYHYNEPLYIRALSHLLSRGLEKADPQYQTAIIFVAHSIPLKQVRAGDPYVTQVEETVALVTRETPPPYPFYLAYQSRLGPVKWQGPSLAETLRGLSGQGVQQLVVQPISFVSENLETLYDLDIEFKKECLGAGIKNYIRVPAPGIHPLYIEALAALVKNRVDQWETVNAHVMTQEVEHA